MLRQTRVAQVFLWTLGPMKDQGVPNNENIDELIMFVKNQKKLRQYYGSFFHRCPDREAWYSCFGGPRGGRFTIRRTWSKRQYFHHTEGYNKFQITHTNPTNAYSGVGFGGMFRNIWDNQVQGTNSWWDCTFKVHAKNLDKNKAIEWMEDWGVRYTVIDENTKLSAHIPDTLYVKHVLYPQNFPWIKDPIVNARIGDIDYFWRGRENLDYSDHGAKAVGNEFRSLWGVKDSAYVVAPTEQKRSASTTTSAKDAKKSDKTASKDSESASGKATEAKKDQPKQDKKAADAKPAAEAKPDKKPADSKPTAEAKTAKSADAKPAADAKPTAEAKTAKPDADKPAEKAADKPAATEKSASSDSKSAAKESASKSPEAKKDQPKTSESSDKPKSD